MKKFKDIFEQYREKGRFHPVKPHNVVNVAAASPRPTSDSASVKLKEDLRKWFSKTDPAGDWKRINSKGEAIGPCAREPGEPKPKCMSKAKRASLSKKERASAVKAKRKHDPNPERKGEPINVSNFGKGKISEDMENLDEKNVPTSPEKWAQAKAQAKAKFDVYPCVPLDSLAISKNGPISHDELNIGDEILTYNMNQDILEWKPIIDKHYYEDAPLLEIGKPTGFSIRCTPNHKWVISKDSGNELVETKDLNTHMRILMCSTLKNDSSLLIENWSKKDNWVEKILSMNEKEREIFLASSVVYDGWDKGVSSKIKDRHTFGFSQKEYDHLWASLLAAYLNGYYVNSREKSEDMTSANYIRNKRYHNTQNLYKKDAGSEDVWCPTTENETWVMIQNGLITITGNSAYANGWASKKYKAMGGGWKSVSEENNLLEKWSQKYKSSIDCDNPKGFSQKAHCGGKEKNEEVQQEGAVLANEKIITVKHKESGKTLRIAAAAAAKYRMQGYHYHPVNEAKDEQEYGYEGDMALNQLATLTRCADMIKELLKPDTDMPEWVQSKITLATDYIQTAADYMYSEMKEEVEQIDEISDNLAGNYLKKVNDNLIKKVGMKPDLYNHLEPKRQKGATRALNRLMKPVEEGTSADSDGGPPTPAASTLTVTGQPKLTKTIGQTKMIPYVHEGAMKRMATDKAEDKHLGSWKVETPWTKIKGTGTVTDKSGAKHTPMSRARDLARQAFKRKVEEQSNVQPNPFTIPAIDIGKAPKKPKEASPVAPTAMAESRQLEIVREAMRVSKKKKEEKVTEAGSDKFIADPELTSQITKSNP